MGDTFQMDGGLASIITRRAQKDRSIEETGENYVWSYKGYCAYCTQYTRRVSLSKQAQG